MRQESTPPEYPKRDPQLFYELAKDRLNTQLSMMSALDGKIGLLVTFASTMLGILGAVFALSNSHGVLHLVLLVAAGVPWAFTAFLGIRAYQGRNWSVGPKLDQLWGLMWSDRDDASLRWAAAIVLWADYEENHEAHDAKGNAFRSIFVAVVIQTLVVALALALVAVGA